MINELLLWITKKVKEVEYGTITVTINIHQGEISLIEKGIIVKEKCQKQKKSTIVDSLS